MGNPRPPGMSMKLWGQGRDVIVRFRASDDEQRIYEQAAARLGVSKSEFIRQAVERALAEVAIPAVDSEEKKTL